MSPSIQDDTSLEPPAAGGEISPSSYYIAPQASSFKPAKEPFLGHFFTGGPFPFMVGLAVSTLILLGGVLAISHYLNKPSQTAKNPAPSVVNNSSVFGDGKSSLSINLDTTLAKGKTLNISGITKIQPLIDSTQALVVQNAAGSSLFTADTANMKVLVGGSLTVSGNIFLDGQICTAAGCFTPIASSTTGGVGTPGPKGVNGKNGLNGKDGADGCSGDCVFLQAGAPGVAQSGNLDITGRAQSGSVLVRPLADATDTFQVQDSLSNNLLAVDTLNQAVNLGADLLPNVNANITTTAGFTTSTITTSSTSQSYNDSIHWSEIGPDGFVRFVYVGNGSTELHLVRCTNDDCSTSVDTLLVTDPNEPDFPSIAMGPDGFPRILYEAYNSPNEWHFVKCNDADCSGFTNNIVGTGSFYEGNFVMAPDGNARIIYTDYNDNTYHFVLCQNADCSSAANSILATVSSPDYVSIGLAPDTLPRVVYSDFPAMHFVQCLSQDCATNNDSIVSNDFDYWSSISFAADGFARIVYASTIAGDDLLRCTDDSCSSPFITSLNSTSGGQPQLIYASNGLPIALHTGGSGNPDIFYDKCNDADCSTSNEVTLSNSLGYPDSMLKGQDGFARIIAFDSSANTFSLIKLSSESGATITNTSGINIGSSSNQFLSLNALQIFQNGNQVCDISGNCGTKSLQAIYDASAPAAINLSAGKNLTINGTGEISAWQLSSNSLPTARYEQASVTANGYVYAIGGASDSSVYYAKLNADGSTGAWQTDANLIPRSPLFGPAAATANGYIYVLGGVDFAHSTNKVFYAKLNADGSTAAWQTAVNLPGNFQSESSMVVNGYIYAIGGWASNTPQNLVVYAKLNADGSTGAWQTNANPLPAPRAGQSYAVANGYVYILGGYDDSAGNPAQSTVYYAKFNSDGSIGAWQTANPLPGNLGDASSVVVNGYVYVIGGNNDSASTTVAQSSIYFAKIGDNGVLSAWTTSAVQLPVPEASHTSITANSYVYIIGGYPGSTSVYYASLSKLIFGDQDQVYSTFNGTLAVNGSLVSTGSNLFQNSSNSTGAFLIQNSAGQNLLQVDTLNNQITIGGNNSGELSAWQTNANSLTSARGRLTSVMANGYIYVVGGVDSSSTSQSTVYYAKVNADGSIGAWQTNVNALPQIRSRHSTVVVNGYIYVIGGYNDASFQSIVYYAKLNADGSTGTWSTSSNPLPVNRGEASAASANGYIYSIAGSGAGSTIYYAKVNSDGSTSAWQTNTNALPASRLDHSSAVANGYMYVIGGSNGSAQTTVYYARLNSDGSTGAWQTNTNPLPGALTDQSSVVVNGYIYTIGGRNLSGNVVSTVYYAKLNADGSTGAWSISTNALPAVRSSIGSVFANGYIYSIGGLDGGFTAKNTIYYASTGRVLLGGSVDLVGLGGANLADAAGTGGSLTAADGIFVGSLQVQGAVGFANALSVNGSLNSFGSVLLKNGTDSTVAFQVQNAAGTALLAVDTTNSVVTIAGTTTTFGSLTITNAHIKSTQTTAPTIGTPTNCGTTPSAAVTAGSTDSAGSFTVTAGTGSPTTCDVVVTFNKAYGAAPKSVIISPTLTVGSATNQRVGVVSATGTTSFTVKINTNLTGNTPAASEKFSFYYIVIE